MNSDYKILQIMPAVDLWILYDVDGSREFESVVCLALIEDRTSYRNQSVIALRFAFDTIEPVLTQEDNFKGYYTGAEKLEFLSGNMVKIR